MTKKKETIKTDQEHAGACPTCGHCKCCEKKAATFIPIQYPICTRPHYDYPAGWPSSPIWYGIGGGLTGVQTTGNITGTSLTLGQQGSVSNTKVD